MWYIVYNQLGSWRYTHLNSVILEDEARLQIPGQLELQNVSFPQKNPQKLNNKK